MTIELIPLPAFSDNYIWLLHDGRQAVVVDPGDAQPVLDALAARPGLSLQSIWLTHHHHDHTGGVQALRQATSAQVAGPARESIPQPAQPLQAGDCLTALGLRFEVLEVPGHTAGHLAFFCPDAGGQALLFCGDTLFSGGCGRLFEGTPAQMLGSLDRLAALPADTRVCCAHEYTLSNLRFAAAIEPGNAALAEHRARCEDLRNAGRPTLPSLIGLERAINPFLRSREPAVIQALTRLDPALSPDDEVAVFARLRQWKNEF